MSALFFISLTVVLYTYVGYPLVIALLARLRPSPWIQGTVTASASVILPVHSGMAMLPRKLESLMQMDRSLLNEIIVILDGADDEAAAWLNSVQDARLRRVILPQQAGKAAALRHGMNLATSELLLFVDVRPQVTEAAIRQLFTNFADPQVGCVAGELRVHAQQNATTASVGGLYWSYEQWIRISESTYSSPVGVYGGFYAIRRSLSHAPPEGLILDDMFQPLWIIRNGHRSVVDRCAVVEDRWPDTSAGEFQRKVRTLAGNFQLCAEEPWLLTLHNRVLFQFVSHKLLRLAVPYCLITMLICPAVLGIHSAEWAAVASAELCLVLLGVFGAYMRSGLLHRLASAASGLLLLNAAAIWALWIYIVTPKPLWKIWTPTPSPPQPSGQP